MRSEFCTAANAKTAASSAAMSHLRQSTEPKAIDLEMSIATMTVRSLLNELLDVRHSAAGGDVPVDRANVIARLVLAHLRELDAASVKGGVVVAGEAEANEPRAEDFKLRDAARHRSFELGSFGF